MHAAHTRCTRRGPCAESSAYCAGGACRRALVLSLNFSGRLYDYVTGISRFSSGRRGGAVRRCNRARHKKARKLSPFFRTSRQCAPHSITDTHMQTFAMHSLKTERDVPAVRTGDGARRRARGGGLQRSRAETFCVSDARTGESPRYYTGQKPPLSSITLQLSFILIHPRARPPCGVDKHAASLAERRESAHGSGERAAPGAL